MALVPLAFAAAVWWSWADDAAILRQRALTVTAGLSEKTAQIRAINDWVYGNQSDRKNSQYFLLRALGPTPREVLASGGDCADKSRLVSAMLRQIGIDSGLVMIFPCPRCAPIHTVVEASYGAGRMVVDPIWDVDYPAGDGRFLGVAELAGTSAGRERIAVLRRSRGPDDKIQSMPASEATFDFAEALNWNKNFMSRAAATGLERLGFRPTRWLRPHFMEDPKLAVTIVLVVAALFMPLLGFIAGVLAPGRDRHPAAPPPRGLSGRARSTSA